MCFLLALTGNCSFYEIPELQTPKPSRGLDIAMWTNNLEGTLFRYKGRCTAPCSGTYQPGTLRIRIDVDKGTTNFNVSPFKHHLNLGQISFRICSTTCVGLNHLFSM